MPGRRSPAVTSAQLPISSRGRKPFTSSPGPQKTGITHLQTFAQEMPSAGITFPEDNHQPVRSLYAV